MPKELKQYLAEQYKKVLSFRKALTSESDRGCALFAAAYLDKSLSDLLYVSLVENKRIETDLFDGTAPLSTFSSRIKFAYYLGKISLACRRDLDIIRNIRNDFAHHADMISFEDQSIRDRCKNLSFSYHESHAEPRSHFTAAVLGILARLHAETLNSTAPIEQPDDSPKDTDKVAHRNENKRLYDALSANGSGVAGEEESG
jgi:hypothetical protein